MLSSVFAFLGGSAFRFLIDRASNWLEKKQAHLQELERIRAQEGIDAARHTRQLEMIRLQSDLKVQEIKLVGETQIGLEEAQAFTEAMKVANKPSGVKWVDAWNAMIRPSAASIAIALWFLSLLKNAFVLVEWDKNLIASIMGYYFADRHIGKQRKA